jgi:hypothetical protein
MMYELFSLQTLFKPRFLCDSKYVSGVSITDAQDKRDINICVIHRNTYKKAAFLFMYYSFSICFTSNVQSGKVFNDKKARNL